MGRASKWLRALFSGKRPDPNADPPPSKKKWKISKSREEDDHLHKSHQSIVPGGESVAAVVRLPNSNKGRGRGLKYSTAYFSLRGGVRFGSRERATVTIQSHFRGYLARRALRALKALVKLQALVRGQLWRKHMANQMRQLQAILRAQARARAVRTLNSEAHHSSTKSSHLKYANPGTPQRIEQVIKAQSMKLGQHTISKRSGSKSSGNVLDDVENLNLGRRTGEGSSWERRYNNFMHTIPTDCEKHDKIVEVDTWRPRATPNRRRMFHSSDLSYNSDQYCQSFSTSRDSTTHQTSLSGEAQSFGPLTQDPDNTTFYTPDSSPQVYYSGGTSRSGALTPYKTEGFRSGGISGYSDHPNYMAYTESSKAKARSFSAPKQRLEYEPVYGYTHKVSTALHANFTSKAYPGSGHLDGLGMPVGGGDGGVLSGPWHRF